MLTVQNRAYYDHLGRAMKGKMPIANQGDKGTYQVDYEVFFGISLSYNVSVQLTNGSSEWILNGANFSDFGLVAGDTLFIVGLTDTNNVTSSDSSVLITLVDGNRALLVASPATDNTMYIGGTIYVAKTPQAVKTSINLVPKEQGSGLQSFIDQTTSSLINENIDSLAIGGTLPLSFFGNRSGAGIISGSIKRLADSRGGAATNYRVEIVFYWWYFLERFRDDFFDVECVSPYIETNFLPLWNNPSVALVNGFKPFNDGNSGFRDENFNQNINKFGIVSMKWFEGLNQIAGFDYSKSVNFEIKVKANTAGGFGSKVGLVLFNDTRIDEQYSASQQNNNGQTSHLNHTLFTENSLIEFGVSPATFDGYVGVNGEKLTFSNVLLVLGTNEFTLTGSIEGNSEFKSNFENEESDRNFTFLVRTESATFAALNYSDTVNLTAWTGLAKAYPPILGKYFGCLNLKDHNDKLICKTC